MPLIEQINAGGNFADRPTPGVKGRFYVALDVNQVFWDDGVNWQYIAAAPGLTVLPVAGDTTLTQANVLVMVTAGSPVVTLPDPVANKGLPISMKEAGGILGNVKNPDGSDADANGQRPWNGLSDGVQWWNTDF